VAEVEAEEDVADELAGGDAATLFISAARWERMCQMATIAARRIMRDRFKIGENR